MLWTIVTRVVNEEIPSHKQGCLSFMFLFVIIDECTQLLPILHMKMYDQQYSFFGRPKEFSRVGINTIYSEIFQIFTPFLLEFARSLHWQHPLKLLGLQPSPLPTPLWQVIWEMAERWLPIFVIFWHHRNEESGKAQQGWLDPKLLHEKILVIIFIKSTSTTILLKNRSKIFA